MSSWFVSIFGCGGCCDPLAVDYNESEVFPRERPIAFDGIPNVTAADEIPNVIAAEEEEGSTKNSSEAQLPVAAWQGAVDWEEVGDAVDLGFSDNEDAGFSDGDSTVDFTESDGGTEVGDSTAGFSESVGGTTVGGAFESAQRKRRGRSQAPV